MTPELNEESVKGMDDVMKWSEEYMAEKFGDTGQNEYSPSAQEAARRQGFPPFDYDERN